MLAAMGHWQASKGSSAALRVWGSSTVGEGEEGRLQIPGMLIDAK